MAEYIDREAVIQYLLKCADGYSYIETPTESAITDIKSMPSADVRLAEAGGRVMNCTGKRCIMQFDKVDPATCKCVSYCPQATPPKINADRIRQMENNELALFFWAYVDGKGNSLEQWREWLKQDVHEKAFNKLTELTTNREEGE